LVEYLTGDKKNIIIQSFVCWRIADPLEFFRAIRTKESAETKLDNIIASLIGSSLGDLQISNLVSTQPENVKITQLEQEVSQKANAELAHGYGICVEHFGISRLALSEENAQSVYRRMRAERASIANEYRALGKEEADKLRAEADRDKSEILANAYRDAEILRGEGDAEAARIYGDAYSKAPEFYTLVRTLEAYRKILPRKTTLVLRSDSALLQYLNRSSAETRPII
jgi:membrane protease subunit HflC